jgi:SAM-dependent methyltransferase
VTRDHWNEVYGSRSSDEVSWYQARPTVSLRLVQAVSRPDEPVVDVGAGASSLADHLLDDGWGDVTVLDLSATALAEVRGRLTGRHGLTFVETDLLTWQPPRKYATWHDRAVLHFLTDPRDRASYARTAVWAIASGGVAVIGTFAHGGPTSCSGLPIAQHSPEDIASLLGPSFVLKHSETEEHITPGGVAQKFAWAVLRRCD